MKLALNGTGVLAVAGIAALVVGAVILVPRLRQAAAVVAEKANPASRENIVYQATGEWGTAIPDLFGGLFKSKAEKEVDAMLRTPATSTPVAAPKPVTKAPVTPAITVLTPAGVLTQGSYRDLIR